MTNHGILLNETWGIKLLKIRQLRSLFVIFRTIVKTQITKGLFTRYGFIICDKLTIGLRHNLKPLTGERHFHLPHAKISAIPPRPEEWG